MDKKISQYTITIDDDPTVHLRLGQITGMPSLPFRDPAALVSKASQYHPVAVFVDINLGANLSGLDLIGDLKAKWPSSPLFIITSSQKPENIETALSRGADDFIKKPLQPEEVKGRLLKQLKIKAGHEERFGDLILNAKNSTISHGDHSHQLQAKEVLILQLLIQSAGFGVTKDQVMTTVWPQTKVTANTLDRRMHSLRKALTEIGSKVTIKTNYGKGYNLSFDSRQSRVVDVPPSDRVSILIVDDNQLNRDIVSTIAEGLDYDPDTAEDGEVAVCKAREQQFDMILMDCQMPNKDGLQASKEILQNAQEPPPIIIAMVGRIDTNLRRRCLDSGMSDFIIKPMAPDALKQLVHRWTSKSSESLTTTSAPFPVKLPEECVISTESFEGLIEVSIDDAKDFVLGLFKTFAEHGFPLQEELATATDLEQVMLKAHKLRGMAENIGGLELAGILDRIETFAENRAFFETQHLMKEEVQAFQKLKSCLEEILIINQAD